MLRNVTCCITNNSVVPDNDFNNLLNLTNSYSFIVPLRYMF